MTTRSVGDYACSTVGSTCSESRHDSQLDVRLMQTINDVKFKNRPKYMVFSDVNFQRDCLDAHNDVRQRHACPPLEWSQQLADLARTWAEKLVDKGRLLYPEIAGVGENIYLAACGEQNHLTSGREITTQWSKEANGYAFDKPKWSTASAHLTQMIWRETSEMGASRCWLPGAKKCAIVVFYRPAGNSNVPGDFQLNVLPPLTPSGEENEAMDSCGDLRGAFEHQLRVSSSPPPSVMSEPQTTTTAPMSPGHSTRSTPAKRRHRRRLWFVHALRDRIGKRPRSSSPVR